MQVPNTAAYLAMKQLGSRIARSSRVIRTAALVVCALLTMFTQDTASAQDAPSSKPAQEAVSAIVARIKVDQGGGFHLTRHLAVVFGGIKQGSGPAAGPAVSWDLAGGAYVQLKAVYSIHRFQLLQARYDSGRFFGERAHFSTRLRWQDAPKLPLFEAGPDAPNQHAQYGIRAAEWSGVVRATVAPATMLSVGSGVERYSSSAGWIDTEEDEALSAVPDVQGLGSRVSYIHSFAAIANDTRLSPDFSRTGRLLAAAVHDYHDPHGGTESFVRAEVAAQQLLPTPGRRGALDLAARAWMSQTAPGHEMPFFLMPTLGGGDRLRGYRSYRFRDRDAVLLSAEYRWAVHEMVDVAGLYEAGTVSPTVGGLRLAHLAQSAGGGIRVHTKTSGLLRLDLARGRDGLKLSIGVSSGS